MNKAPEFDGFCDYIHFAASAAAAFSEGAAGGRAPSPDIFSVRGAALSLPATRARFIISVSIYTFRIALRRNVSPRSETSGPDGGSQQKGWSVLEE